MNTKIVAITWVAVLLVGCGGTSQTAPTSTATPPPPASTRTAPGQAPTPTGAPVMELPAQDPNAPVVSAVEAVGAATLNEAEWVDRFPASRSSVPTLAAELIEAATVFGDGQHTEERSWLVVDPRDRFDLVAELKQSIGAVHVQTANNTNDDESLCTETIGEDDRGVEWTVRACDYPSLPDTHAVGIVQTTPGTPASFTVDASIDAMLALSGGELTHVSARLQVPQPGEQSLLRSARIALPDGVDVQQLVDALKNGPLDDYGVARNDDSAVLTGPRGETWTLTTSIALFEAQGPW